MTTVVGLIPPAERSEILYGNIIQKAVALSTSNEMKHLMIIWKTYIEPTMDGNCNLCYERVLRNFKELQPLMIQMEQDQNLLNTA